MARFIWVTEMRYSVDSTTSHPKKGPTCSSLEGEKILMATYQFPDGFVWGVATAAAQIEGAARVDGKGESIWDRFAALPGNVKNGDTPEVACDHYHLYEADFDLMSKLGISHYRLSVAWPRVFPRGRRTDQLARA